MGHFASIADSFSRRTMHCVVVVTLMVLFLLDYTQSALYTNQVAVHIEGGEKVAHRIAKRHGFINLGQIGLLEDHYLFEHPHIVKRSASPSHEHHSRLSEDQEVRWFEQQVVLSRKKRGFSEVHYTMLDPNWADQWYLHRDKHLDMNVLPAWEKGYSGKGVVITILDDGIEKDHPDLVDNYDPDASYDINSRDADPQPRYDFTNENRHGTRCAGEVSAAANNSVCGVGVAFKSSIGGVRMLDGDVTDAVEAASLSLNPQHIDIYSASWGPDDDGQVVDGPGRLAKQAFISGITKGRNGKGSLFVWASGNGGHKHDSCNCDGYTNSIFTLSVSSTSEDGNKPWYLEECSSTLATTYSSGGYRQRQVVTTDLHHLCTKTHTGTSAAAPLAAGIVALVLEANPALTWRDVQYITMLTARTDTFADANWVVNSLGRKVSLKYGYGLMDASAMVELAEKWVNVPQQHTCEVVAQQNNIPLTGTPYSTEVVANGCEGQPTEIKYLEHVQINVTMTYSRRGDVSLHLTSPKGTTSTLLVKRQNDRSMGKFDNWPFMSVHFWGEDPTGTWKLEVHNEGISTNHGTLDSWSLRLHGTAVDPLSHSPAILNPTPETITPGLQCHSECAGPCTGEKPSECESCKHYQMVADGACVGTCPNNTYLLAANATCAACDNTCHTCHGPEPTHCGSCFGGWFLMTENNTCVMECGDGYFEEDPFGRCSTCDPSCKTCQGSAVTCTGCRGDLELIDGTCMPEGSCTHNQFKNQRGVCEACHIECATCTGRTRLECESCVLDDSIATFLKNHTCVLECSHGYYKTHPNDISHPSCQRCHTSCQSCHGPSISDCDSCLTGFALTNGKCVDGNKSCVEGQFKFEDQCLECHATCLSCSGPTNAQCLTCPSGSDLVSRVCVSGCVEGTYAAITNQPRAGSMSLCAPCHVTCASCNGGSEKDCTKCRPPLQLVEGGLCRETKCKNNEYLDLVLKTCVSCDPSCSQCTGPGDHQCVSCSSSFLLDGACVQDCPEGFYPATDSTCQPCYHGCQKCTGAKAIECLECQTGLEMGPEGCVVKCPKGNFYDTQTEACRACAYGCDSCTGESPSQCMSCRSPLLHHRPSHRCLPCCTASSTSDCCTCLESHSGECFLGDQPSRKRLDQDSDEMGSTYLGLIVAICVIPVLLAFLVFIVLQLRSGHRLCWRHRYSKVPLTFDPVSEKLSQAVLSFGDDELRDDEELFSNSNSDPNHNKHIPMEEY